MEITFTHPEYLWFLFMVPILIIVHFVSLKSTKRKALKFANFDAIERVTGGKVFSRNLFLLFIRLIIVILFIFALAGATYWYSGAGSNFDFVLAIDSSSSMLTTDIEPSRLEAAKIYANDFLDEISPNSKVGVVSFAGTSIIEQELIDSFTFVRKAINNIQIRNIGGTDIGEAIITSSNLFIGENPGVIILLTDGQSNVGININDAIEYIKSKQIIIYTIGVGTETGGQYLGNVSLTLDEGILRTIAENTEGKYFLADSAESLRNTYIEIANTTETRIKQNLTFPFFVISLILVLLEWTMINTKYKTIP